MEAPVAAPLVEVPQQSETPVADEAPGQASRLAPVDFTAPIEDQNATAPVAPITAPVTKDGPQLKRFVSAAEQQSISQQGTGVRAFADCVFNSSSGDNIVGVWWSYENSGSASVSIARSSSSNVVHAATQTGDQPTTFLPGFHRYAFMSYFSAATPSSWTLGNSVATATSTSLPRCRDKVFIQPKLDCVKEVGINPTLTAQLSYTMESIDQSGPIVPYLEIPLGESNFLSDYGTPPESFYAGHHVRGCTSCGFVLMRFVLRMHINRALHRQRSASLYLGQSSQALEDEAVFLYHLTLNGASLEQNP
jgi:hypothetical protein